MEKGKALEIANEFLRCMNPDDWDGKGETPASLKLGIYEPEARIGGLHLEIMFENKTEECGEWFTYVDLVDCGCSVASECCEGVNSAEDIAGCIEAVCRSDVAKKEKEEDMDKKKEWLEKQVGLFDIPADDEDIINFYYMATHDHGMSLCDADDYAWLNTLFRYDIGADRAKMIIRWYYEKEDVSVQDAVSFAQKEALEHICTSELGLHLDFSHWPDTEPKAIQYGFGFVPGEA